MIMNYFRLSYLDCSGDGVFECCVGGNVYLHLTMSKMLTFVMQQVSNDEAFPRMFAVAICNDVLVLKILQTQLELG